MGWFRRSPDWSVDPVLGTDWKRQEAPRPDLMAVLQDAILQSGVDPAQIDRAAVMEHMVNTISAGGAATMAGQGDRKAADGLVTVSNRPDCTIDMLWNYFSHQEALGIAVQRMLAEMFNSGEMATIMARQIRDGSFRS